MVIPARVASWATSSHPSTRNQHLIVHRRLRFLPCKTPSLAGGRLCLSREVLLAEVTHLGREFRAL